MCAVPATAGLRVRSAFSAGARGASTQRERNDGVTLALHPRSRHRHARPARPGLPSSSRAESEFSGARLAQPAAASSALPVPARATVGVVDPAQRLSSLAAALPDAWRLTVLPVGLLVAPLADPASLACDALVLIDADGGLVRMARTCFPRAPIAALLSVDAPVGRVVEVRGRAPTPACGAAIQLLYWSLICGRVCVVGRWARERPAAFGHCCGPPYRQHRPCWAGHRDSNGADGTVRGAAGRTTEGAPAEAGQPSAVGSQASRSCCTDQHDGCRS